MYKSSHSKTHVHQRISLSKQSEALGSAKQLPYNEGNKADVIDPVKKSPTLTLLGARVPSDLVQMTPNPDSYPEMIMTSSNGFPLQDCSGMEAKLKQSKGAGSPLPSESRRQMEGAFGHDFSNVRIHTDSNSVQMNRNLNAKAFTHGSHIYFNSNKYNTTNNQGKKLLAHELTHVVQQGGGDIKAESPDIMRTCDCSDPREHPAHDVAEFLRQSFPGLTPGTYCYTSPPHSRYNCYGHSVGSFRTIEEQEIVEQYGRRTYRGENSILYSDLDSFYGARGLAPMGYWHDCPIIAYGTGTTPKHVARRSERCNGRYLYESKLGLQGPEVSHYPEQLEGTSYGSVQRGYFRGRLPETPDVPTMIPYQQPQRFIPSGKLEDQIMLSPSDTPQFPVRTPYRQPPFGVQPPPLQHEIVLKIIQYDGAQSLPPRDVVRNIYHRCGIQVRFNVLNRMNRQDTLRDLNGDTTLNLGRSLRSSIEVQNIQSRFGPLANNEVPVVFVENIVDHRYRSPAGQNSFGVICAISNNTSYPAIILAHEVGHYFLGPGHSANPGRLMNGVPTDQSTRLSSAECSTILS